ncbi:hypothetical protein niasHS_014592 [Heterodera schachtii]|uniref:Amino acid transporter n=1 Tax=Heterodera schachtii TaxID=97005 RepID=A0ABD2ING4_HETSC
MRFSISLSADPAAAAHFVWFVTLPTIPRPFDPMASQCVSPLPVKGSRRKHPLLENLLLVLTLISVFIGIGIAFFVRQFQPSQRTIDMIGFPGELFMNLLKSLILPLIAASLVSGLSQLDTRQSGRIGAFAALYYAITMVLAVTTGICLVLLIHPGDPSIKEHFASENDSHPANVSALEKLMDLLRNMFPDNIVQATFQQMETEYVEIRPPTNVSSTTAIVHAVHRHIDGMNTLGMIMFFIALGLVMGHLGREAKPLADLFNALNKDLSSTARMLALYVLTVFIGLMIHLFLTLPAILFVATRKNPYRYMRGLLQAAITALGTASTAASLPVTFRCVEQNNGVHPQYTKFVLPVGALVNMDGTALYEAVASMFIAQMNGMEMTPGAVLTMAFTATLASLGAASMPSAGLVTMLIVLTAVGLPASDVTMIIAVDWLLDRIRTATNVIGDGIGCGFVEAMVERRRRRKLFGSEAENDIGRTEEQLANETQKQKQMECWAVENGKCRRRTISESAKMEEDENGTTEGRRQILIC